jgi:hypothetical protein
MLAVGLGQKHEYPVGAFSSAGQLYPRLPKTGTRHAPGVLPPGPPVELLGGTSGTPPCMVSKHGHGVAVCASLRNGTLLTIFYPARTDGRWDLGFGLSEFANR